MTGHNGQLLVAAAKLSPGQAQEVAQCAYQNTDEQQEHSRPSVGLAAEQVCDYFVVSFLLDVSRHDVSVKERPLNWIEVPRGAAPTAKRFLRCPRLLHHQPDAGELGQGGNGEAHGGSDGHGS